MSQRLLAELQTSVRAKEKEIDRLAAVVRQQRLDLGELSRRRESDCAAIVALSEELSTLASAFSLLRDRQDKDAQTLHYRWRKAADEVALLRLDCSPPALLQSPHCEKQTQVELVAMPTPSVESTSTFEREKLSHELRIAALTSQNDQLQHDLSLLHVDLDASNTELAVLHKYIEERSARETAPRPSTGQESSTPASEDRQKQIDDAVAEAVGNATSKANEERQAATGKLRDEKDLLEMELRKTIARLQLELACCQHQRILDTEKWKRETELACTKAFGTRTDAACNTARTAVSSCGTQCLVVEAEPVCVVQAQLVTDDDLRAVKTSWANDVAQLRGALSSAAREKALLEASLRSCEEQLKQAALETQKLQLQEAKQVAINSSLANETARKAEEEVRADAMKSKLEQQECTIALLKDTIQDLEDRNSSLEGANKHLLVERDTKEKEQQLLQRLFDEASERSLKQQRENANLALQMEAAKRREKESESRRVQLEKESDLQESRHSQAAADLRAQIVNLSQEIRSVRESASSSEYKRERNVVCLATFEDVSNENAALHWALSETQRVVGQCMREAASLKGGSAAPQKDGDRQPAESSELRADATPRSEQPDQLRHASLQLECLFSQGGPSASCRR